MRLIIATGAVLVLAACSAPDSADSAQGSLAELRAELQLLEPLIGKCWRAEFPDGEHFDVHCYDLVFDGAFIRDVHAVPGEAGIYRGETLYHWDEEAEIIRFRYYNSLGGVSDGTAEPMEGGIRFPNEIHVEEDGSARIFGSTLEWRPAGGYAVVSTELTDPENPVEVFSIYFREISRATAEAAIEGGL